jgi:hypothetical protein
MTTAEIATMTKTFDRTYAAALARFGDADKALAVTKAILMGAYDEINAE